MPLICENLRRCISNLPNDMQTYIVRHMEIYKIKKTLNITESFFSDDNMDAEYPLTTTLRFHDKTTKIELRRYQYTDIYILYEYTVDRVTSSEREKSHQVLIEDECRAKIKQLYKSYSIFGLERYQETYNDDNEEYNYIKDTFSFEKDNNGIKLVEEKRRNKNGILFEKNYKDVTTKAVIPTYNKKLHNIITKPILKKLQYLTTDKNLIKLCLKYLNTKKIISSQIKRQVDAPYVPGSFSELVFAKFNVQFLEITTIVQNAIVSARVTYNNQQRAGSIKLKRTTKKITLHKIV